MKKPKAVLVSKRYKQIANIEQEDFFITKFVNINQFKFPKKHNPNFDHVRGSSWIWSSREKNYDRDIKEVKDWIRKKLKPSDIILKQYI